MDDPLKQHLGRDVTSAIQSLEIKEGKAKQTGNPYTFLNLTFVNGYAVRIFLDSGGKFAVSQAITELE